MVEAIRNLLKQSDTALSRVKSKLKEEKDKNLVKLQEQLPTPEDIMSQIKAETCSTQVQNELDKKYGKFKDLLNNIKGILEEGIKKLQALKDKLNKITEWMGKIGELLKILGKIILICEIIAKVLPKALNFFTGLAANGFGIKKLSDLIDKAKSKIENMSEGVKCFVKAVEKFSKILAAPFLLIDAAIAALQGIIDFIVGSLLGPLEQLYLFYLAQCNLPSNPVNTNGSVSEGVLDLVIDGLEQGGKDEILEKIYNANFETIGYRRYKKPN